MKSALVATVLLSAVLPTAAHAQAMFRGGPAHDGVYAAEGPRQFHRVKWTFPTGNRVMSSPVMQGNVVYFGSDDGNVYAMQQDHAPAAPTDRCTPPAPAPPGQRDPG